MQSRVIIEILNDFVAQIGPLNRVITVLSDLLLPVSVARAACSGCSSEYCGAACINGMGYRLYRHYNTGQCSVYDCWRYCSTQTNITC